MLLRVLREAVSDVHALQAADSRPLQMGSDLDFGLHDMSVHSLQQPDALQAVELQEWPLPSVGSAAAALTRWLLDAATVRVRQV